MNISKKHRPMCGSLHEVASGRNMCCGTRDTPCPPICRARHWHGRRPVPRTRPQSVGGPDAPHNLAPPPVTGQEQPPLPPLRMTPTPRAQLPPATPCGTAGHNSEPPPPCPNWPGRWSRPTGLVPQPPPPSQPCPAAAELTGSCMVKGYGTVCSLKPKPTNRHIHASPGTQGPGPATASQVANRPRRGLERGAQPPCRVGARHPTVQPRARP